MKKLKKLCVVNILTTRNIQQVFDLGGNNFYFAAVSTKWYGQCAGRQMLELSDTCTNCVVSVACQCSLQVGDELISAQVSQCATKGEIQILHTFNPYAFKNIEFPSVKTGKLLFTRPFGPPNFTNLSFLHDYLKQKHPEQDSQFVNYQTFLESVSNGSVQFAQEDNAIDQNVKSAMANISNSIETMWPWLITLSIVNLILILALARQQQALKCPLLPSYFRSSKAPLIVPIASTNPISPALALVESAITANENIEMRTFSGRQDDLNQLEQRMQKLKLQAETPLQ